LYYKIIKTFTGYKVEIYNGDYSIKKVIEGENVSLDELPLLKKCFT